MPIDRAQIAASAVAASASEAPPARTARDPRPGLSGLGEGGLEAWLAGHRQPAFRARQVRDAVWNGNARSVDEMLTLPAILRGELDASYRVDTIVDNRISIADGGLTEKTLHQLSDGSMVESVLMHYRPQPGSGFGPGARPARRERHTLCISSQAGCAVGCPFCATGELGFGRDLETAEILDQVRHAARRLAAAPGGPGGHLTNVVFMGMGEPLLNLDHVLEAVVALADPRRFGLGARHVVVSTSGVVPGIRRLTEVSSQLTLAISLHAASDPLRDVLVPLNRRWPVADVVAAAREHARMTGRRVSYEYVMISGVNDTDDDADSLGRLLRGDLAHVNLIPMNPVAHTPWQASSPERIARFAARVRRAGVGATVRANRGLDAGAACGQLAADRAGQPTAGAVVLRREAILRRSEAALRGDRDPEIPDELASALSGPAVQAGETR
jgi:23S rRNA (adenine2503-C2)-methyltransferase